MTTFASLGLSSRILNTLTSEGYETPTPIQAECIPPALEGRDLLGCAQTGTGKTAAFSLPLIDRLAAEARGEGGRRGDRAPRRPRALVLAPTRELACQIEASMRKYGRGTGMRGAVIYGGVKQSLQVRQLREGVDVIIATPGRLLDLMEQGHVDLGAVQAYVLDEADRMLDMGFIEPIRQISRELPSERQTLFFSATMPPKIRALADSMLRDPVCITVASVKATAPKIDQSLYHVPGEHKTTLLKHLIEEARVERGVVFTKTKHGADRLAESLTRDGISSAAIHGNRSQSQRERTLGAFRAGRFRVLVATDVAARGLDVDGITYVFNYNLPMEPEAYVHRIGRTGRAGAEGRAISFCSREERRLLRDIARVTRVDLDPTPIPAELGINVEPEPVSKKARYPRRNENGGGAQRRAKSARGMSNGESKPAGKGAPKAGRGGRGKRAERSPHAAPQGHSFAGGRKQRRKARSGSGSA